MIEITRFCLNTGAEEAEFLVADKTLQEEFAYQQPGLRRRTTARSQEGEWVVIDLWSSSEEADACSRRWDSHPVVEGFMSFVDRSTFTTKRYTTID